MTNFAPATGTDKLIDNHKKSTDVLWALAEELAAKVCTCGLSRHELMMPAAHKLDCPVIEASLAAFEEVAKK